MPVNALKLRVAGRWAQFRKPETNNNPLTHDLITKTAFIGLMGAVLGKERISEMRSLFPQLSEDLRYGVRVNTVVKKESWGFTLRDATKEFDVFSKRRLELLTTKNRAPKQMEFLRDPDFTVVVALQDERSRGLFDAFSQSVREGDACYTPVLGLHNCPAELEWQGMTTATNSEGEFVTEGFVPRDYALSWEPSLGSLRVGYEKLPTHQNDDWWNLPDHYVPVAYPSGGAKLKSSGNHARLGDGEAWCLI